MCLTNRVLYSINYDKGAMRMRKKLSVFANEAVDDIFYKNDWGLIIGGLHSKAINHEGLNIGHIKAVKKGNKAEIFYTINPSLPLASGLGFIFIFRSPQHGGYDPETNKYGDEFELSLV